MKYGETLRQRSIPEWSHYNIDYDYLKYLIKHHTTPGAGTALSIPGQGHTTERAFGETFLKVLRAQHDRINLFVKSKSGEIERRLDYISKQLEQLQARYPSAASGSWPAKTVEKYARVDADIARAGEEIRSLSRFRIAQQTGFNKILKKYRRWTKDREIERRFVEDVSSSPTSFFQLDLGYLLDQYIDVLGALRATLDPGTPSPHVDTNRKSSASRLSKIVEEGSQLDYDAALSTIPLGPHASSATYWIHPDTYVEAEVLLLSHMRLFTKPHATSASPKDSPQVSPFRTKSPGIIDKYSGNEKDVGLVVLDNPTAITRKQNASTREQATSTVPMKAAGNARWSSPEAEAVVMVRDSDHHSRHPNNIKTVKVNRKHFEAFLSASSNNADDPVLSGETSSNQSEESTHEDKTVIQHWIAEHGAKPIASIRSQRTRFVGLQNNLLGGMWGSLDRNIVIRDLRDENAEPISFPHAVLEIRREGTQPAGLIHILDDSHLVQRVPGFSLETHAVWACCKPSIMSPPSWATLLDQDIRKLPKPVKRQRRDAPSATGSPSHLSVLSRTSTQGTSVASPDPSHKDQVSTSDLVNPLPLRAFEKQRRPYSTYIAPAQIEAPRTQTYWNEYDNPESEEEGYYIYVDPNASVKLPGQELLEAWVHKTRRLLRMEKSEEDSPLLSTLEDGSSDDESSDESHQGLRESYGTMRTDTSNRPYGGYFSSLFRSTRDGRSDVRALERGRRGLLDEVHARQHERETVTFLLYASCLGAASVLDIILGVLATASRRKLRDEVDRAVILGIICNLLLLLAAVTGMMSRRERLGWFHQGSVFSIVLAMVVVDVLLFRWALRL